MEKRLYVAVIWRPEAATPTGIYSYDPTDPFDGLEIAFNSFDESKVEEWINKNADEHPEWKFLQDSIRIEDGS